VWTEGFPEFDLGLDIQPIAALDGVLCVIADRAKVETDLTLQDG
jgi:hypothetical protein